MGKNKGIKNLAAAIEAVAALQEAKTAKASDVQAVVAERMSEIKAKNKRIDAIVTGLKADNKDDAEIAEILRDLGLSKIDTTEVEKAMTAQVQVELDSKKTKSFYESLGEIAVLSEIFNGESEADNSYAPAPPQVVVVPAEPTIPQVTTTTAAPNTYQPQPSQWDRHVNVTRDIRSERFEIERQYKNGEISFGDYVKLKSALNLEAFSQHCSVTATKRR